jgi:hypothetical protein
MAKKLIGKLFKFPLLPDMRAGVNRGLSGGSSMCRPGCKNPHRRHWKFLNRFNSFGEEKLKNVELASQLEMREKTMPLLVATTTLQHEYSDQQK